MNISLGFLAVCIAIVSYGLYFRDIFRGHTKPHAFTWLIWSVLNGVIFYQQLRYGGGAGAWVTGLAFIADATISFIAMRQGSHHITKIDWICLSLASGSIGALALSLDANISVLLASVTFAIGFIPTVRKSHHKPHQETAMTFFLNGTKFLIAVFALDTVSFVTALYPLTLFVLHIMFATFLVFRRASKKPQRTRKK